MTDERWRQIEALFVRAVECPPAERGGFLDQACHGDRELRRELDSLLACDAPDQPLIELSVVSSESGNGDLNSDLSYRRIGPYRIVQLIGHGGMGSVYMGIRDDAQYDKRVAIKLLNRGMDTDFMLNRFRQERQILANLEHPFIARLFDGGATEDGLPYLVMEYVDGITITKYCTEKNLTVSERLRLFRLVCEAVQYAHQNLVVHRDIKPSNILATKEAIPKLLDFGIAKVVDPTQSALVTLTQPELRMMTPEYASPEQVKGLPISTASDIYSLGAVLYELLTNQKPHLFTSNSAGEIERVICDTTPEKPSLVVNQKPLKRQLSGDLDNIILAAMRKEPQRRYASVAELSEDIRRHMDALPIVARDDQWTYRAGKFVRRHKFGVVAAALLVASLIGGIVAASFQARRAERRFQIVRGLANSMLFELHDRMARLPGSTAARAATIRTVVKYLDALTQDGSQDPDLDLELATAYERVGNLEGHPFHSNLGRGVEALSNYRKALGLYERISAHPHLHAKAIRGLIDTHLRASQLESLMGNPSGARAHFQKASAVSNEAFAGSSPAIPPATQINVYARLADAEYEHGNADGEIMQYRRALEVCQKWYATDPTMEATSGLREAYRQVGSAQARAGDLFGARKSYLQAQKIAEDQLHQADARYELRYDALSVYVSTGDLLAAPDDPNFGDRTGATSYYQTALAIAEELAKQDPRNVNGRRNVASCYWRLGMLWAEDKPSQAVDYSRKSVTVSEALRAGDPLNAEYRYHAARAYMGLGAALHKLNKNEEAVENLSRAVDLQKAIIAVSPERIWNLRVLSRTWILMGNALLTEGNSERAIEALREGLAVADRMLERAPLSLSHQLDRADALEALGAYHQVLASRQTVTPAHRTERKTEALSWYRKSLEIWEDWNTRKVAIPYTGRRLSRVKTTIASIHQH